MNRTTEERDEPPMTASEPPAAGAAGVGHHGPPGAASATLPPIVGAGLERLLTVANTRHGPGGHIGIRADPDGPEHDHLADAEDGVRFLVDHAIPVPDAAPSEVDLGALREVQLATRALATGDAAGWARRTAALLDDPRFRYRLRLDGRPEPVGGGWDRFTAELLPALIELGRRRDQLRVCGNRACRWLFLDRSRNRSRRWCDMSICGNRSKVRRYRRRSEDLAATAS